MHAILVALAGLTIAPVASAQTLEVTGDCPGDVTLDAASLTAGANVAWLYGLDTGDDLIPRGACAGTVTGLGGVLLGRMATATFGGNASVSLTLPEYACDVPVQLLDLESCTLTNIVTASGGGAPGTAACAYDAEAEHPGYTNPEQTIALCGNNYDPSVIDSACADGWHVCRESEWQAGFPSGAAPMGALSTWGADQSIRCTAGTWIADAPESGSVWGGDVCDSAYNPWNSNKCLYSDDGVTVLEGSGGCCSWDSHGAWVATSGGENCATYCCAD